MLFCCLLFFFRPGIPPYQSVWIQILIWQRLSAVNMQQSRLDISCDIIIVNLSVHLSIRFLFVGMSVCLYLCPSIRPSVPPPPAGTPACLPISLLSVCLSVCLYLCPSINLSICLSVYVHSSFIYALHVLNQDSISHQILKLNTHQDRCHSLSPTFFQKIF